MAKATDKQVRYALLLLRKAGYSTKWMDASFKALGAGMQDRRGSVTSWLENMDVSECSALIEQLSQDEQGTK